MLLNYLELSLNLPHGNSANTLILIKVLVMMARDALKDGIFVYIKGLKYFKEQGKLSIAIVQASH